MSKVHLIKNCGSCIYRWYGHCTKADSHIDTWDSLPDWCPFPTLPERKDNADMVAFTIGKPITKELVDKLIDFGWNACLDAITGGKG